MSWWEEVKQRFFTYGETCFDYSRDRWVGFIYVSGLAVTLIVALILGSEERQQSWYWPSIAAMVVVVSMGLQILRERALSDRTQEAERESARIQAEYADKQKELSERQQDLVKLLKTMPPSQSLDSLTESYETVLSVWRTFLKDPSIAAEDPKRVLGQCEQAIRICLNAIARLYLKYEYKPLDCRCTAHFAEFIPLEDIEASPALKSRVLACIRFVDYPDDPLHNLIGVLWVRPELSGFAEPGNEDSWDRDFNLKRDLCLPLPKGPFFDRRGRTRSLPIAPQAFELGMVAIPDIGEEGIEPDKLNVSPTVLDDVKEYLSGDEDGRLGSVIGYRLLWAGTSVEAAKDGDDGYGDIRLGVLTLFTDAPNSKDGSTIDAFFKILRPLIELKKEFIVAMMGLREQVQGSETDPDSSKGD